MYGLVVEYTKRSDGPFRDIEEWLKKNSGEGTFMTVGDDQNASPVHASVAVYVDDKQIKKALVCWMIDRFPNLHLMVATSDVYAGIGAKDRKHPQAFHDYTRSVWMKELAGFRQIGTVADVLAATKNNP